MTTHSTIIHFSDESLPPEHPLHGFDGSFHIRCKFHPGTYDSYTGDPPECEDFEVEDITIEKQDENGKVSDWSIALIDQPPLAQAFLELVNDGGKLYDKILEQISEAAWRDEADWHELDR